MSSIPAYERDTRMTRLDTEVVAIGEQDGRPYAVLADTVLYPEGGGQPADHGSIAGVQVLDVQKSEEGIRHFLAEPVPVGPVTVELDFQRRFDHMQQHTGQHLLTAVADQQFGWHTLAFHLGERVCDIELDAPRLSAAQLEELEEAVAVEIRAARAVTARRVDEDEYQRLPVRTRGLPGGHTGSIRLVEIEGIDLNTCGGTHCASTAELEALKLLGTESMRGGTRLFYVAGRRLRRLHGAHHLRNAELRSLLGVSDDEVVERVSARLDQAKEAERTVRHLKDELATASAASMAADPARVLVAHWAKQDLPFLQRVAREIAALAPDRVVFLTCGDGADGAFVLGAGEESHVDLRALGAQVAEILGGRGGGSGTLFQGKATRLERREEAAEVVQG